MKQESNNIFMNIWWLAVQKELGSRIYNLIKDTDLIFWIKSMKHRFFFCYCTLGQKFNFLSIDSEQTKNFLNLQYVVAKCAVFLRNISIFATHIINTKMWLCPTWQRPSELSFPSLHLLEMKIRSQRHVPCTLYCKI